MKGRFRPTVQGNPASEPALHSYLTLREPQQISDPPARRQDRVVDSMRMVKKVMGRKEDRSNDARLLGILEGDGIALRRTACPAALT